ncbi:MAG: hypothetical protein DRJ50_08845 [Actinobacteria bacterium]|nr:MAG: hypothetical protein DRJ50_08845 [Actinomycetota bacterium]
MPEPTSYEIVIRGRASARLLRPLLDDFTIEWPCAGSTRLIGFFTNPSHLYGVVAHLTSVNAELISITQRQEDPREHTKEQSK